MIAFTILAIYLLGVLPCWRRLSYQVLNNQRVALRDKYYTTVSLTRVKYGDNPSVLERNARSRAIWWGLGLAMLWPVALPWRKVVGTSFDDFVLPPRAERQKEKLKVKDARILELEAQLDA